MKAFISGMQNGIPVTHTLEGTLFEVLTEALEMFFRIPLPEFPSDTEEEVFRRFISVIEDTDDQLAGEIDAPFIVSIVDLETGTVIFSWDNREGSQEMKDTNGNLMIPGNKYWRTSPRNTLTFLGVDKEHMVAEFGEGFPNQSPPFVPDASILHPGREMYPFPVQSGVWHPEEDKG